MFAEKWVDGCTNWKICAFSGPRDIFSQRAVVTHNCISYGWIIDKDEKSRIVVEHPHYDSPVEITFTAGITQNGMHYALCFKPISIGFRIKEARIQENLCNLTISLIPWQWQAEAYCIDGEKEILVYKNRHCDRLCLKRRRKW